MSGFNSIPTAGGVSSGGGWRGVHRRAPLRPQPEWRQHGDLHLHQQPGREDGGGLLPEGQLLLTSDPRRAPRVSRRRSHRSTPTEAFRATCSIAECNVYDYDMELVCL